MKEEKIYTEAKIYDLYNSQNRSDINFYVSRAAEIGGPILDLACGTGILSLPIAERGLDVYGIDLSPEMIDLARLKAEGRNNIKYTLADITDFSLCLKFKMIFLGYNTICHLKDYKTFKNMLESVKKYLLSDGLFFLDCFIPDPKFLYRNSLKKYPVYHYKELKIFEQNEYDSFTQINKITRFYIYKGEQWIEKMELKQYYPQEVKALLELGGFNIKTIYGDHNGDLINSNSPFQIYKCNIKVK